MDIIDRLKGLRRNLPIGIQSFEDFVVTVIYMLIKQHLSTN